MFTFITSSHSQCCLTGAVKFPSLLRFKYFSLLCLFKSRSVDSQKRSSSSR